MEWKLDQEAIDWEALSELYRIAPLGNKGPDHLQRAYANSMFKCFLLEDGAVIGAGRAVADGVDCAYLCDIVIHPAHQGRGLGAAIVEQLMAMAAGHAKLILYANPGKEGFYEKFGFRRMRTAMALFKDQARAIQRGLVEDD